LCPTQAIPDRSEPRTLIDQTNMTLALEPRGPDHSKALMRALRNHVLKMELVN